MPFITQLALQANGNNDENNVSNDNNKCVLCTLLYTLYRTKHQKVEKNKSFIFTNIYIYHFHSLVLS